MPWPTARKAVPMAAVVLPLPGPVFTIMTPRRMSCILAKLLIVPVPAVWRSKSGVAWETGCARRLVETVWVYGISTICRRPTFWLGTARFSSLSSRTVIRSASTSFVTFRSSCSFIRSTSRGFFMAQSLQRDDAHRSSASRIDSKSLTAEATHHEGTRLVSASVPQMVRMALENGERPIELFQQHYASQLVCQRHLAQRKHQRCGLAGFLSESIRRTHREQ